MSTESLPVFPGKPQGRPIFVLLFFDHLWSNDENHGFNYSDSPAWAKSLLHMVLAVGISVWLAVP